MSTFNKNTRRAGKMHKKPKDVFDEKFPVNSQTFNDDECTVFDDFSRLNCQETKNVKMQQLEESNLALILRNQDLCEEMHKKKRELLDIREDLARQYSAFRRSCRHIRGQIRNGEAGRAVNITEEYCGDDPSDYTSDESE